MKIELNISGDSPRSHAGAGVAAMKMPSMPRTHFLDQILIYAERGLMVYALFRLANSENFQEMVRNRYS